MNNRPAANDSISKILADLQGTDGAEGSISCFPSCTMTCAESRDPNSVVNGPIILSSNQPDAARSKRRVDLCGRRHQATVELRSVCNDSLPLQQNGYTSQQRETNEVRMTGKTS